MDSPVKPANDAKGEGAVRTIPSLQRKLESRADHPLDSSVRWNDAEGGGRQHPPLPYAGEGAARLGQANSIVYMTVWSHGSVRLGRG